MPFLWVLVIIGAVIGGFDMVNVVSASLSGREISAPQQAAGAAMAVAWAVIPYVLVRAIEKAVAPELTELRRLNETLATHTRLLAQLANTAAQTDEPVDSVVL